MQGLVLLGECDRLLVVDPGGEPLSALDRLQLALLGGEALAGGRDPRAEVVEPHARLHERLLHLREPGPTLLGWGRAVHQIAPRSAEMFEPRQVGAAGAGGGTVGAMDPV